MTKEQMENIIQKNMQKIYLYCVKRLENTAAAEDVASDIILELLRSYDRIANDEAVYGYIWSVANNLCKNYWRRKEKEDYAEIPEDFVGMYCYSPEESFLREEEIMLLRRELSLLKENYRRIMISYYIGGRSCEEIADKYSMSVSNVKQYLFEGRKKLKEGMDMVREYGKLSYAPEKFTFNFWGNSSKGYWELFERKLPGNIMIAAYQAPKTLEELSVETGVSLPYLEDEVAILEKMDLLVRKGKTYQSNIVLYDEQWMNTKMNFPLLSNGSTGYVMGIRGEYQIDTQGIYGWYNLSQGHMRILNFMKLSEKALNPFEHNNAVGKMLEAAVEGKPEPEEVAVLSKLLQNGYVSVKNGKLCPEFAMISESDYDSVKSRLSEGISMIGKMIAQHRDMAGEELRKKTPAAISGANEVGAIVSMWSVLEGIVDVMLKDGYMTKGSGQNLTTFYFKADL